MSNDGNGNVKADTPDRPAADDNDNNQEDEEDMDVDENENSNIPGPEDDQDHSMEKANDIDDPYISNEPKEDMSKQVKQSDVKTDKENVKKDMILTNPFIYPKPSKHLPDDRPAFLFKPGVLEQAFSHRASSSGQSEPLRSVNIDQEVVGSEDGHGEDAPAVQPDIQLDMQVSALPEDKQVEDGAVDQAIGVHNASPLVDEIQDMFEEGKEVARQTQDEEPLGNEDENYFNEVLTQTSTDQPNRVQDLLVLGVEDGDEEADEIAVSDDYNSKNPDIDKSPAGSQYEEMVVVDIIKELEYPLGGNESVNVLPNARGSPAATAPVTTAVDSLDVVDDIFEVTLEEHTSEASTSSHPVPVDTSDSDDDHAFSLLELADSHLQCPICMEVFIVPTTINCGHTFCQDCIQDWKKKHKLCPYCRTRIKIMVTSNSMDQFITEMFGLLDEEGLERRREFARQRESKNKKKKDK